MDNSNWRQTVLFKSGEWAVILNALRFAMAECRARKKDEGDHCYICAGMKKCEGEILNKVKGVQ